MNPPSLPARRRTTASERRTRRTSTRSCRRSPVRRRAGAGSLDSRVELDDEPTAERPTVVANGSSFRDQEQQALILVREPVRLGDQQNVAVRLGRKCVDQALTGCEERREHLGDPLVATISRTSSTTVERSPSISSGVSIGAHARSSRNVSRSFAHESHESESRRRFRHARRIDSGADTRNANSAALTECYPNRPPHDLQRWSILCRARSAGHAGRSR